MDALTLLRQDHRTVEGLFKKFESAGERAYKTKRRIADRIIRELSIHAAIEEEVFYPAVRERIHEEEDGILEALEEHRLAKQLLAEIDRMDPEDERFDAKVTVMIESVRHHKKEEEEEMFPDVRKAFTRTELREMGERMERAKATAPTRPHPNAPDEPPGNVVLGPVVAAVDRAKDALKGRRKGG